MTLDQRLIRAVHHVADGIVVPEVDFEAVRSRARANRRRTACAVVAAVVLAVIVAGTTLVGGRDTSGPAPVHPVRPPELGGALGTPYWHDGVLHVGADTLETPYRPVEVAGDTVLVAGKTGGSSGTSWALVRDHELTPITAGADTNPALSFDGRIAFWWNHPTPQTTRYVAWDTETDRELASRDFAGLDAGENGGPRLYVAGIDANGIAYVVDERSNVDVTRWDVRADTEEPAPGLTSADMTYAAGYGELRQDQFVSPDGTKEVFTGRAPGDSPSDCCVTLLRVRPVGSDDPNDVVRLRLPEGVPRERLWDPVTDEGTLGVWWETNQTVLLESTVEAGSEHLVRCSTTDGSCKLVFELDGGPWRFARFPVTG
jgi:hypothetical protein